MLTEAGNHQRLGQVDVERRSNQCKKYEEGGHTKHYGEAHAQWLDIVELNLAILQIVWHVYAVHTPDILWMVQHVYALNQMGAIIYILW